MKQTFYFQHDNNAYNDEKIIDLRIKYGVAGYGAYWAILEQLHQNNGKMQLNSKRLAFALQLDDNLIESIIKDFDLFIIENNIFYNKRLLEHFKKRESISKIRAKIGKKGGLKSRGKQAIAKQLVSKNKQRKGKERKGNNKEKFNLVTVDFVKQYLRSKRFKLNTNIYSTVDDLIQSWKDYHISKGTKIKDYKASFRTWCRMSSTWKDKERRGLIECLTTAEKLERMGGVNELLKSKGEL